jgi:hypothetical protein
MLFGTPQNSQLRQWSFKYLISVFLKRILKSHS